MTKLAFPLWTPEGKLVAPNSELKGFFSEAPQAAGAEPKPEQGPRISKPSLIAKESSAYAINEHVVPGDPKTLQEEERNKEVFKKWCGEYLARWDLYYRVCQVCSYLHSGVLRRAQTIPRPTNTISMRCWDGPILVAVGETAPGQFICLRVPILTS